MIFDRRFFTILSSVELRGRYGMRVASIGRAQFQIDVVTPQSPEVLGVLDFEALQFGAHYGETAQTLAESFAPFIEATMFVRVRNAAGEVVGMARMIGPSAAGLPAIHDVALPGWRLRPEEVVAELGCDPASTWEIGTITALSGVPALASWHAVLFLLQVNRVGIVVAMLDDRVGAILNGRLKLRVSTMPGAVSAPYYGSPASTPIYARVEEVLARQCQEARAMWDLVTCGIGLPINALTDDQVRAPAAFADLAASAWLVGPRPVEARDQDSPQLGR
jgi:hypothetical protein